MPRNRLRAESVSGPTRPRRRSTSATGTTRRFAESQQEAFVVLAGECTLLVEGEERLLRQWDFFHCPAGTEHIFVGAGDAPCAIFMAGSRVGDWRVRYPVSELAARHGVSVEEETTDPREAYTRAGFEPSRRARPSYWNQLPWA
jgi:uncharacterized cupin superfamily protein